ncbi:6-phosphogluconate dehydrogenase protein [Niveomyces insectorum RCEF 264]|uniref:6-phosphogluconate dehydrogenase protein n=1 Tax=Niveomyces insectorum RCEF 264 TaxID=1081102 RepID=A0A167MHS4_9HYPO|nr:6-phosphogluconate dehydrogenase protein [Niveomyces insectorum RCEF 264]
MVSTIGVLSIGEMGLGIAQLLQFHGYRVITNVSDRSKATRVRAEAHNIATVETDLRLVQESDYIFSIVPPRDALATLQRMKAAVAHLQSDKTVHFLDLNAISPSSSHQAFATLENCGNMVFHDGVISGGVPRPTKYDVDGTPTNWHCPTLLMSGPNKIMDTSLIHAVNIEHMSDTIGAAVAVKMCFGMVTKGYIALAIQAFTTAHRLGVLSELESFLNKYKPTHLLIAQEGLVRMPHTAYRWVYEMLEMADTASDAGGFRKDLFRAIADTYRVVAEDTVLGGELPDSRVRGKTVLDVVTCIGDGLEDKNSAPERSQTTE